MERLIIDVDMRTKAGKALKELIEAMSKSGKDIRVVNSPYDPSFVKIVKTAEKSKSRTKVNPDNIWESIE